MDPDLAGKFSVLTTPLLPYVPRIMKTPPLASALLGLVLPVILSSCLFKDPVFTEGFTKTDDSIVGVWTDDEGTDDPAKTELAACFKVDESNYMLHYPARDKDGMYFAAQPLKVNGRELLQLRGLGTLTHRPVKPGDKEVYTLLWIEKQAEGSLKIRPLKGDLEQKTTAEVRKLIEDKGTKLEEIFVDPKVFKRIPSSK